MVASSLRLAVPNSLALNRTQHPPPILSLVARRCRINGVTPHTIRLMDTPGVPHPYQLSARLSPEEVQMLLPRRQLKPRTFAMKMGQTLLIGGLARVDVKRTPKTGPLYLTLWYEREARPPLSLFLPG